MGIDFSAVLRVEATTDLHWGFGWPDIPFCLIVGEEYLGIKTKASTTS